MLTNHVEKPQERGALRSYLGKEYYILKRKLLWLRNRGKYAIAVPQNDICRYPIIQHRSFLLRPLKDVDMILQHNKVTNLRLAIAPINGVVIKPGQIFSIWKLVGRPKRSKGYLDGLVLHNGQISKGCGGGLCQLGNLLYWMALHSELDIVERWRHGYDVFPDINRTIPFACGATLSYNYVDLQLKNNTPNTYRINLWLDEEYLNGELLSDNPSQYRFEVYETDHMFKSQWWGGYTRHNKIWRKRILTEDNSYTEELMAENHAVMMYNPLLPY
ncbi:VanW family protein [Dysgonomonas sp. 25]|uniref:VanW family protein n=1 Tax=Dysgonomonas sp. 25 TaxID=2302933 RepID=UPI0013D3120A|nr:VanW family protein [Dysgonomonas sp. 25]NDV70068.1 vancomycin resistance protein [Dysgonomonas sp. 25]